MELGLNHQIRKSEKLWEKSKKLIGSGVNTFSRGPGVFPLGSAPIFLEEQQGSKVKDVDQNWYIDWTMSCGSQTLGHNFLNTKKAIITQLEKGISFSLLNELEIEVAEKIVNLINFSDMIKFSKNGSDVCNAAVKIARHVTGRDMILVGGYHGFHDFYVASTDRNFGIPQCYKDLVKSIKYNDVKYLEELFDIYKNKIACIIMEPILYEKPKDGFLQKVKEMCHQNGTLLIFDEMLSFFRFHMSGAQAFFNVEPDLMTFGKGLSGGMPLGVIAGPERYLKEFDKVFLSSTYSPECLTLAAASATIDFYKTHPVIETLWKTGEAIETGCKEIIKKYNIEKNVQVAGYPVRLMVLTVNDSGIHNHVLASLYQQEMIKRGNLVFSGVLMLSYSHSEEDIQHFINSFDETCKIMKEAIESKTIEKYLTCKVGSPVFKSLREHNAVSN